MTELSFLIDLLMNHKLTKVTKDVIAERIRYVESNMHPVPYTANRTPNPAMPMQAASTLAAMARHGDIPPVHMPAPEAPEPVAVVAHTPAAAAAMASRQQAIAESIAGKVDKTTGRPKKF